METVRLVTALLLPWLLGVVWLQYCWNPLAEGGWATLLGYGYVLGILATVLTMLAVDLVGLPQNFFLIAAILSVLAGLGLWLSRGLYRQPPNGGISAPAWHTLSTGYKVLWGILLMLIVMRFAGFALEIVWRPLYPWDAWVNWAPKARVWFEHQALIPFVDRQTWLSTDQVYSLSNEQANRYPPLVPLVQLWMSLAIDRWDESLINLPWLFVAAALGLAFYGQARNWGVSPLPATVFVYFLFSMPLIGTHIALAGYAELWLATFYALAVMAFVQWVRTGDRHQAGLALIFIATLPLIKIPGIIWMMTFIPALLTALLSPRFLIISIIVLVLIGVIVILENTLNLTIPGLGQVILSLEKIRFPYIGEFRFDFEPIWDPFYQNLFVLANWHLFWPLFLVTIAVLIFSRLLTNSSILTYSVLVLTAIVFLLFIFFFIPRYQREAINYTTINRAIMHMIPTLTFFILIVWQERLSGSNKIVSKPFGQ